MNLERCRSPLALQVQFALNLQHSGKSYYAINQWGPFNGQRGPNWPPKVAPPVVRNATVVRAWVLASYLMSNLNASGTTLVCQQCYGFGAVNYSWWPEDGTPVGRPLALPVKCPSGIWSREYSHALVYANPGHDHPGESASSVTLPSSGGPWRRLLSHSGDGKGEQHWGNGATLSLNVSEAAILVPMQ